MFPAGVTGDCWGDSRAALSELAFDAVATGADDDEDAQTLTGTDDPPNPCNDVTGRADDG